MFNSNMLTNIKKSWLLGLCGLLLVANLSTLLLWRPWSGPETLRKITVTGESTIKSQPDEYQFNPYYQRSSNDEIAKLSQSIVDSLKKLGVSDDNIKVTVSNYGLSPASPEANVIPDKSQSTLSVNLTVNTKELAQKVQDYLITTNSNGLVTPNSTFSTTKQKQLQDKARSQAITDARKKADQSAADLGSRVDKVLEVTDRDSGGYIVPLSGAASGVKTEDSSSSQSMPIQPGQNEINYSVQVTFSLR